MKKIFSLILITLLMTFSVASAEQMKITMIDIGQGDSFLIEAAEGNVLIDTGPTEGKAGLLNKLNSVGRIDKIFLTHPHADHIANAAQVIYNFAPEMVYDNGTVSASKYYKNYLLACGEKNSVHQALKSGDKIFISGTSYLEILNPNGSFDVNNDSLVLRLVNDNFTMLFTGDIGFAAEADILNRNENISAKILKAAHHGSKGSSAYNFVEAVHPEVVLISCARNNKFGHPTPQALKVFSIFTNKIYCTAYNGEVVINTDGNTYSVQNQFNVDWLSSIKLPDEVATAKKIL